MPRKIPAQVPQAISRLLESGFLKRPPVWYDAVTHYPPAAVPPRHQVPRPDEDLPLSFRSTSSSSSNSNQNIQNSKKKLRSQGPSLSPKPIFFDEDTIRQQFYRDHPWEAYRPKIVVEMDEQAAAEDRVQGDPKRLRSYGRNPSVEDFIACTLAAHKRGGLSLSQAYHNTLSSYYGLRAEREHAIRYAILEAKYYGADLGKSETQRGFEKEDKELDSWTTWAAGGNPLETGSAIGAQAQIAVKAVKVKRTDETFTDGELYLQGANAFRDGKAKLDDPNMDSASDLPNFPSVQQSLGFVDHLASGDFLGLATAAFDPKQTVSIDSQAPTSINDSVNEPGAEDDQRFRNRVGTSWQRI